MVLHSKGSPSPVMMTLLRSCAIRKGEERRIRFVLACLPPSPPLPYGWEVIQMLADGSVWNTERTAGQMAGLWGRAGCALAGPHPVALIFFFPPEFLSLSFSLSALCCRSSAFAATPVILLSISSITPSFLYLSLYLFSLHHRRGCLWVLIIMVWGFSLPPFLSSLSLTSDQPLLLSQPTFAPVFSVLFTFILSHILSSFP